MVRVATSCWRSFNTYENYSELSARANDIFPQEAYLVPCWQT